MISLDIPPGEFARLHLRLRRHPGRHDAAALPGVATRRLRARRSRTFPRNCFIRSAAMPAPETWSNTSTRATAGRCRSEETAPRTRRARFERTDSPRQNPSSRWSSSCAACSGRYPVAVASGGLKPLRGRPRLKALGILEHFQAVVTVRGRGRIPSPRRTPIWKPPGGMGVEPARLSRVRGHAARHRGRYRRRNAKCPGRQRPRDRARRSAEQRIKGSRQTFRLCRRVPV